MNIEYVFVGLIVGGAVFFVARKAIRSLRGERGTCRSCGDSCGCAVKDAIHKNNS